MDFLSDLYRLEYTIQEEQYHQEIAECKAWEEREHKAPEDVPAAFTATLAKDRSLGHRSGRCVPG